MLSSALQPTIGDNICNLRAREDEVFKFVQLSEYQAQRDSLKKLLDALSITAGDISRLLDRSTIMEETLDPKKLAGLLSWLSSTPTANHHHWVSRDRLPGSGAWIIRHPVYKDWLGSSLSSATAFEGAGNLLSSLPLWTPSSPRQQMV